MWYKKSLNKDVKKNNKDERSPPAPDSPEETHIYTIGTHDFCILIFSLWSAMLSLWWMFMFSEVMKGLCAGKQVKKWWHCVDTPFQTDSHRNFWLWFPPRPTSDGWNEKDSYTYFKARGSTKGLRNKEVWTFELNKGPSPTYHIRCAV